MVSEEHPPCVDIYRDRAAVRDARTIPRRACCRRLCIAPRACRRLRPAHAGTRRRRPCSRSLRGPHRWRHLPRLRRSGRRAADDRPLLYRRHGKRRSRRGDSCGKKRAPASAMKAFGHSGIISKSHLNCKGLFTCLWAAPQAGGKEAAALNRECSDAALRPLQGAARAAQATPCSDGRIRPGEAARCARRRA